MSSDLRELSRLSRSLDGGSSGGRRRRVTLRRGGGPVRARSRIPRGVVLAAVVALLVAVWLGVTAWTQADPEVTAAGGPGAETVPERAAADATDRASRSVGRTSRPVTFARVGDLRLVLPHPDPVLVAFGEGTRSDALSQNPVGRLVRSDNDRFEADRDRRGPQYRVLASQGRPRGPTSAADVVVPADATVVAPVTGTVVEAREYAMARGGRDWRVVIQPEDRPDLHVVVVHLHRPAVGAGDLVEAGATPLAVARRLSFTRAVDEHLDESLPHVHLEVRPATQPEPPDPNEPATVPDPRQLR